MANLQKTSVSFVMPAYNCAKTVAESVESIMDDNFKEGDELIIVDDCSTDATVVVLEKLKKKYNQIILVHNAQNMGCPASRNVGIKLAKGPLIFNLDSDDVLSPGSVEKLQDYMDLHGADVVAFGEIHYFKKNIKNLTHVAVFKGGVLTLADYLAGPIVPGGNYLYKKESWEKVGGYWEYGKGLHEFWGFSLKLLASGLKFVILPGVFYFHRHGDKTSLFIRESKNKDEFSLMATKMIVPYLHLLEESDAEYIKSEEGSKNWFANLNTHPIKLKDTSLGQTGRATYFWPMKIKNFIKKLLFFR